MFPIQSTTEDSSKLYSDDVFSTYLYTGNGSTQTINNGIDLAGKGGMVWVKSRSSNPGFTEDHNIFDSVRTSGYRLLTNTTDAQTNYSGAFTGMSSSGFSIAGGLSVTNIHYASYTFRKAPKFFDVVTYTGTGTAQNITHDLGSQPGMILIKSTSASANWIALVRGGTNAWYNGLLDNTAAMAGPNAFDSVFTSTTFLNAGGYAAGVTYVAYLFANNAGGFGLTGTDNVITCGSYTGNGSATGPTVTLGYEPQWVMVKASSASGNWVIEDVMRGMSQTASNELFPNTSGAETALNPGIIPNATGFSLGTTNADMNSNGVTYIYMAIRRPNKPPTSGTQVFGGFATTSTSSVVGDYLPSKTDLAILAKRNGDSKNFQFADRLRGFQSLASSSPDAATTPTLVTSSTAAESVSGNAMFVTQGSGWAYFNVASSSTGIVGYTFKRAPRFFDVVCYTGTSSNAQIPHNLAVRPNLAIIKCRSAATENDDWFVFVDSGTNYLAGVSSGAAFGLSSSGPTNASLSYSEFATATYFYAIDPSLWPVISSSGKTYVAYLFASLPGVSKVFSFVGNGTNQNIECGFSAGARFVLLKRTNAPGDWLVADSARGIVAGNDPSLALNSTAAERTTVDWIDPYSGGFNVVQESTNNANVNGATYIGLAIA